MVPLPSITPSQVLGLWHRQPRVNEHSRLIAFSNDLVRMLQHGRIDPPARSPLCDLDLPRGVYNALRRAGYSYIDEVERLSTRELLLLNHVGATSVKQILNAVGRWKRQQARRHLNELCDHGQERQAEAVVVGEQAVEALVKAFYACCSDRERMAALLLRAADLIRTDGPTELRQLAMALLDSVEDGEVLQ